MATGDIDRIEWPFLTGNPLSAQKDAPAQAPGTRRTVRNVWGSTNLVRYFSNFAADPAHRAFATCSQPALPQLGAMLDDHIVDLAVARKLLAPRSRALPQSMRALLALGPVGLRRVAALLDAVRTRGADIPAGSVRPELEIRFLPPIPDAEKFLCVGKNYRTHLEELKRNDLIKEMPGEPTRFIKLNSCRPAMTRMSSARRPSRVSITSPSSCSSSASPPMASKAGTLSMPRWTPVPRGTTHGWARFCATCSLQNLPMGTERASRR